MAAGRRGGHDGIVRVVEFVIKHATAILAQLSLWRFIRVGVLPHAFLPRLWLLLLMISSGSSGTSSGTSSGGCGCSGRCCSCSGGSRGRTSHRRVLDDGDRVRRVLLQQIHQHGVAIGVLGVVGSRRRGQRRRDLVHGGSQG